ncbi:MAG: hypothetical protein V7764_01145, partial [Pseudomonas marincola]|uniref:hypothetical protein n=1 Tax=Pseudomonas marincola TaxID=437900 RepID=UPI0030019514
KAIRMANLRQAQLRQAYLWQTNLLLQSHRHQMPLQAQPLVLRLRKPRPLPLTALPIKRRWLRRIRQARKVSNQWLQLMRM